MSLELENNMPHTTALVTNNKRADPRAQKRRVYLIIAYVVVGLAGLSASISYVLLHHSQAPTAPRTYFTYSQQDVDKLRALGSAATISISQASTWQDKAYGLVEQHSTVDVDASKVYTYLAVAQLDATALSYKAHHAFIGSIEPISKDILCTFYADSCGTLLVESEDTYSKALSDIVMTKVVERIKQDNAQTKPYVLNIGPQYWSGPSPQIGISAGSSKPWLVRSSSQFRVQPPPAAGSVEQRQQLAAVKQALATDTDNQKAIVVKWAGGPGTKTPPGIWLSLADNYMQARTTSVDAYLETRSVLSMTMTDAIISVFDSKYTYQYKRPNMFDPSIMTVMPTPNHPSYPAGHATISWAAAAVLSHYFPANQPEWRNLAKEETNSQLLGGINFPIDNVAGTTLGIHVGNEALKHW